MKLQVGDKILLKCTAFKGKHKIQDLLVIYISYL